MHDIGREAIRVWVEETSQKYRPQLEVLSVEARGDEVLLKNRISGDFPGSPVELNFAFALRDGEIEKLDVG